MFAYKKTTYLPAKIIACLVGAWPDMAWHTLPMYTSSTASLLIPISKEEMDKKENSYFDTSMGSGK